MSDDRLNRLVRLNGLRLDRIAQRARRQKERLQELRLAHDHLCLLLAESRAARAELLQGRLSASRTDARRLSIAESRGEVLRQREAELVAGRDQKATEVRDAEAELGAIFREHSQERARGSALKARAREARRLRNAIVEVDIESDLESLAPRPVLTAASGREHA